MASGEHWREADSAAFLDYGALFVPQREAVFAAISALIPADRPGRILELGCGAGELAAYLLAHHPQAALTALDASPAMCAAAQQRLNAFGARAEVIAGDLAANGWRTFSGLQAIVSSLAVHHLDHADKLQLFHDCRTMLAEDGVLVLFDVVLHRRAALRLLAAQDWDDAVAARCRAFNADDAALQFFRDDGWNMYASATISAIDKPATSHQLLNWLSEAGLRDADLLRQFAGHALFAAFR